MLPPAAASKRQRQTGVGSWSSKTLAATAQSSGVCRLRIDSKQPECTHETKLNEEVLCRDRPWHRLRSPSLNISYSRASTLFQCKVQTIPIAASASFGFAPLDEYSRRVLEEFVPGLVETKLGNVVSRCSPIVVERGSFFPII